MPDDDLKFRLPIKSSVEIPAELYLKAAEHGARLPQPMNVERLVEKLVVAELDRAARKHKIVIQYKPERETR